jgi:hypothetical protein
MNTLILFAATGLFAAGATAGIISVVTIAIRREEKNLTLTSAPPDRVTRAGRWVNGVGVRATCRAAADWQTTAWLGGVHGDRDFRRVGS